MLGSGGYEVPTRALIFYEGSRLGFKRRLLQHFLEFRICSRKSGTVIAE